MKWPSVSGERVSKRDGASPYTIVETKLADCARRLASKPESQRHLYEIHTGDGTVLSAADALEMVKRLHRSAHPPPEEDLGGGDICSLEAQPSTDDDQPLD
jgi:hypothetical protein